jgi:RNA polymerase sigma-70 factor (ECF subfamily)
MQTPADLVGETYTRLRQPQIAYLRRQVRDPAAAEDLLQQVFLKALVTLRVGKAVGNLSAWLYRVARTTAVDHFRRHRTRDTTDAELVHDPGDDERMRQRLASCLRPLVVSLPPLYRDVLIAMDFDGRTMPEFAAKSRVSVSAVKSRVSRGRRLLKSKLLECCDVEMVNGSIGNYQQRRTATCGKTCSP